jgi:membrane protease YdiL (CAAX protease family)
VLTVGLLSPLIEEIIFRGFMLNRLLTFFSQRTAVFLSSVIFALCHANFFWMLYALPMGIFMANLSVKKDNILYTVFFHIGFNFPAVVIAVIQRFEQGRGLFFGNGFIILLYGLIGMASAKLITNTLNEREG